MVMVERRGDSKTRTFRIDSAIDDEIVSEAEKSSKSVNSYVENILLLYLNHGRYTEESKALTILPETLKFFLQYLDDDSLAKIGEDAGREVPRHIFMSLGIVFDDKAVLEHLLKVIGGSGNWFQVSYHEGKPPYLFVRSNLGHKWLVFVKAYINAFYDEVGHQVEIIQLEDNLQVLL